MKTSFFLILTTFILGMNVNAQVELTNMSISETNAKYLYSGKMNRLYLNNMAEDKSYEVRVGETILEKAGGGQFNYKVLFVKENKLDIYENNVLIKSEVFPVKRIAESQVQFGNLTSTTASVVQLLETPTFTLVSYDSFIEDEFIAGFKMTILGENGAVKKAFEATKGANFTPEQIEMIATLQAGDKIEINDLVYTDSEGISRKKNTFFITVE
ncbi:MAG: hypothetical protein WC044_05685 [Crocinitomicaceae bacterium]